MQDSAELRFPTLLVRYMQENFLETEVYVPTFEERVERSQAELDYIIWNYNMQRHFQQIQEYQRMINNRMTPLERYFINGETGDSALDDEEEVNDGGEEFERYMQEAMREDEDEDESLLSTEVLYSDVEPEEPEADEDNILDTITFTDDFDIDELFEDMREH